MTERRPWSERKISHIGHQELIDDIQQAARRFRERCQADVPDERELFSMGFVDVLQWHETQALVADEMEELAEAVVRMLALTKSPYHEFFA